MRSAAGRAAFDLVAQEDLGGYQRVLIADIVGTGLTMAAAQKWLRNADGSYSLYFGYLNRNAAEELHVPIGPDNTVEPGGDRGQPTYFYPAGSHEPAGLSDRDVTGRRRWWVFKVDVPGTWTEQQRVTWTLRSRGKTNRAAAWLQAEYEITDDFIRENAADGHLFNRTDFDDGNRPPALALSPGGTVNLPGPAMLTLTATDDGRPKVAAQGAQARRPAQALRARWVTYRGLPGWTLAGTLLRTVGDPEVHVGAEKWLGLVALRGGAFLDTSRRAQGTAGAGFRFGNLGLDLGLSTHSRSLTEERGLWVLQWLRAGEWGDLYAFTLEPHYPIDFEMANHYTSTHPSSRFVQTLTAQRSTPEARLVLRHRELTVDRGEDISTRPVEEGQLLGVLSGLFGLDFPPGTRFPSRAPSP